MTKEEFQKLSCHQQDEFLADGGKVSSSNILQEGRVADAVPTSHKESVSTTLTDSQSTVPPVPFNLLKDGLDIKDPVELLFLLDDDIREGRVKLHKWQTQFMLDFADPRHTKDHPFKAEVRACNGSGKDKYIVAACVVWLCMRYQNARGVVTNGSGQQLDNQTEVYVNHLCQRANAVFGIAVWKLNYRYYECLLTQSPVTLFATDEPNKAEGYHPLIPGAVMAIFASEAKAIPQEIFTALNRCTGFSHRVDVSTPGLQQGVFYERCMSSISRETIKDIKETYEPIEYHIDAIRDCPHITKQEIETLKKEMPGGEEGIAYQSAVHAKFGASDNESVVIPFAYVNRACRNQKTQWKRETYNKAGLDLSAGGDETALSIVNGNKQIAILGFKFDNTEDTIDYLIARFEEYNLNHPECLIFADCGGLGSPMLQRIKRLGWSNIRFIDPRWASRKPRTYLNRVTESWFDFGFWLQQDELILQEDPKLIKQLSNRYYKIDINNKHRLLAKAEQRGKKGLVSPDRADATILSFWDYKSVFVEKIPDTDSDRPYPAEKPSKPTSQFDLRTSCKKDASSYKQYFRKYKQLDTAILKDELDRYNLFRKQQQLVNQK